MLQAVKFFSSNALGTGQLDGGFLPCFRVSYGAVISPCSSRRNNATLSHVQVASKKYPSKDVSLLCKGGGGYNGHSRNSHSNQENGLDFSVSSNWQKEETGRLENLEELEISSLEDGLMNSLSNAPRFRVTEIPGPKEKEIVELFRKIQVQLRERSTTEKKLTVESLQGKTSENGSVDSLSKLLRKHSSDQGARKLNGNGRISVIMGHSVQNVRDLGFLKSSNHASSESENPKPNFSTSVRPESYFRSKSTVSHTRRQHSPVYRRQNTKDFSPYIRKKSVFDIPEPDSEQDPKPVANIPPEHELEHEPVVSNVDMHHNESDEGFLDSERDQVTEDISEGGETENRKFTTLKLTELRSIAKARGIKGFSKLKKSELAELLSSSSD